MNEARKQMLVFGELISVDQIAACERHMRDVLSFTQPEITAVAATAGVIHAKALALRLLAKNKRLGLVRRRPSSFIWDWIGVGQAVSVYLAGPDVFRPDQAKVFTERKSLLVKHGFVPLCPMDNDIPKGAIGRDRDKAIYRGNLRMVRACDLVLANVNSFRGPGIDDGTAFEIGAAAVLGKTIFGYRDDLVPMHKRFGKHDAEGLSFEAFGNAINLMMENAIFDSGGALICGSFSDAVAEVIRWRSAKFPGGQSNLTVKIPARQ